MPKSRHDKRTVRQVVKHRRRTGATYKQLAEWYNIPRTTIVRWCLGWYRIRDTWDIL
jgi:hypothetical protein